MFNGTSYHISIDIPLPTWNKGDHHVPLTRHSLDSIDRLWIFSFLLLSNLDVLYHSPFLKISLNSLNIKIILTFQLILYPLYKYNLQYINHYIKYYKFRIYLLICCIILNWLDKVGWPIQVSFFALPIIATMRSPKEKLTLSCKKVYLINFQCLFIWLVVSILPYENSLSNLGYNIFQDTLIPAHSIYICCKYKDMLKFFTKPPQILIKIILIETKY